MAKYLPTIIEVDGVDLTPYLKSDGYQVEEFDVSNDAGRMADGTMDLNYVDYKKRITLITRPLVGEDFRNFFVPLSKYTFSVHFFNPYSGQFETRDFYRGDRNSSMKWDIQGRGTLINECTQQMIEI